MKPFLKFLPVFACAPLHDAYPRLVCIALVLGLATFGVWMHTHLPHLDEEVSTL